MPIFQVDLDHRHDEPSPSPRSSALPRGTPMLRRLSEESIRTELCEGPIPDSPRRPSTPEFRGESRGEQDMAISDRAELIERLKRGESPTWIPNRHLESILQHHTSPPSPKRPESPNEPPSLLPAAQITPKKDNEADDRLQDGLSIERPRSALHSGDFTLDDPPVRRPGDRPDREQSERRPIRPDGPWISTSPPRHFTPFQFDRRIPFPGSPDGFRSGTSPLSSSLSSSFVYQPPTSPLVQSESNEDLDLSMPLDGIDFPSRHAGSRRYTASSASSPFLSGTPIPSKVPSYRREAYQAHQPRRSLTSTPSFMHSGTSPQFPFLRSRRSSFMSDSSPLHHASMVGSYEESILRGRMSTTPSKPLDFLAQIGVLGKGKCKPSLRCPPHVTIPFPAVYYSYSNTPHGRSRTDDGPSPYVGQIDLENGLPNLDEEQRSKRKAQSRYADRKATEEELDMIAIRGHGSDNENAQNEVRRRNSRAKRGSGSSARAPPGGSYRIPEKGQIQIIIKNQNKTAVKLFLVPYDLTGMEPGTKTFVRQRSHSAGPIIENLPTTSEPDTSERPILRYLVQLHICCPSRGRFYLYKSIRIVFANRVPDGKEKLRNETTWPDPRYSPYKPVRVMHPSLPVHSGPGANLAADKAFRRRSSGFPICSSTQTFDALDTYRMFEPSNSEIISSAGGFAAGNTLPIDPIPFNLPARRSRLDSDVSQTTNATGMTGIRSSDSSQASRPSTNDSAGASSLWGTTLYEKLNKGDLGYGGISFPSSVNGSPAGAEGLLSQRLRGLGVKTQRPTSPVDEDTK